MKTFKYILGIILACSTLLGIAGTIDPLTDDSKYIEYGKKFKYVYKLCGVSKTNEMFCGSCVAIGPRWVLTAAHVIDNVKICGISEEANKQTILALETFSHEDYNKDFGYGDIGLVYLSKDLDLDFYPELYSKEDEVGKLCCISGYGLTGTFLTGQIKSDHHRRAGSNIIDKIDRHLLICSPSLTVQSGRTELEFLIASGDSGGGLFIDGKLAGINSCVIHSPNRPRSTYTNEAGHTRISKYIPWIKKIISSKEITLELPKNN